MASEAFPYIARPLSDLNSSLLQCSLGGLNPAILTRAQARSFIYAIEPAPWVLFDGQRRKTRDIANGNTTNGQEPEAVFAHPAGVTALAIEPKQGR